MTEPARRNSARPRPRYWALALAGVGGVLLAGILLASVWSALGGTRVDADSTYRFGDETVYLNPSGSGDTSCVIARPNGQSDSVSLRKSTNTALFAHGSAVAGTSDTSELRCSGAVQVTSGWVLALYPLSEANGWLAVPCVVAAAVGWVYRKP
ncbi:hypothetical protein [Actinokineospora sp.]|uniref:hypothetical protein n=1 Tax=Actinokineospora sp. TaxID=1872133 RepID=UPI004037D317